MLLPTGKQILRLKEADGSTEAVIDLPLESSRSCSGTILGSILIQPVTSGVCAVDLSKNKVTISHEFGGTIDSDCAVIDGMAYFSVRNDNTETMYCTDIGNGFSVIWEYSSDADITSATVQGEYVIFGAGDTLVAHHYKEESFCEIPVGVDIIEAPFASQYAVFFSDSTGNVGKLRLNSDGTMEQDSLVRCEVGASPSTPLQFNNSLYVSSETGLHILDSINMEITHTFGTVRDGSTPFICRGNGERVYCVGKNEDRWEMHCTLNLGEDNAPTDQIIALMDDFTDGRSAVSKNGTLYFRDSMGRLFALTKVEYNIFMMIMKIIITFAFIAGIFIWIRILGKRRSASMPKY